MQEIKLNEPFTLEGKMVKIVECEPTNGQWSYPYSQPKKERWFKCLKPENYKHSLKKMKPYRFDFIPTDATVSIQYMAGAFPNDFEEVTPDFICQHSGEAFMMGDACWYIISFDKNDNPDSGRIDKFDTEEGKDMAYFHTESDALAWQEAKFGKKEEEIEWWFTKHDYIINSGLKHPCRPSNETSGSSITFTGKTAESDCIAARDKWIAENAKVGFEDMVKIINDVRTNEKRLSEIFVEYILNKGGK